MNCMHRTFKILMLSVILISSASRISALEYKTSTDSIGAMRQSRAAPSGTPAALSESERDGAAGRQDPRQPGKEPAGDASKTSGFAQGGTPIVSDHGEITIYGFVQAQYNHKTGDREESTFSCKRARLGAKGPINEYAGIKMMLELADSPYILDAIFTISPHKKLVFSIGQFKPPFGTEFLISAPAWPFITTSRSKNIGTDRDIGASVMFTEEISKDFDLKLTAGLFNGSGKNTSDANKYKNFIGRAELTFAGMFTLAPNAIIGKTDDDAPERDLNTYGASLTWKWRSEILEGEYIQSDAGELQKAGWYVWGGHTFSTGWKFLPEIQVAGRYEEYDADTCIDGNKVDSITIGTNLLIDKKYTKIQLNYKFNGEEENPTDNDEIAANFQVMF